LSACSHWFCRWGWQIALPLNAILFSHSKRWTVYSWIITNKLSFSDIPGISYRVAGISIDRWPGERTVSRKKNVCENWRDRDGNCA
jgi:hypothetical protein